MSRVVGVDVRDNHVRVVALNAGYRKLELLSLGEELLSVHSSPAEAIGACLTKLPPGGVDTLAVAVDGGSVFSHRLDLPESARKRLSELLPFELEAVLPIDIDELVFDHAALPNDAATPEGCFSLLTVAARQDVVQALVDSVQAVTGRQPERVGSSPAELGHLSFLIPALKTDEPIALVDMGYECTDVCVLKNGVVKVARSLSMGVDGFPDSAPASVARLKQTLGSFAMSTGEEVTKIVVLGEGATLSGIDTFLSDRMGMPVERLPEIPLEGMDKLDQERSPLFAKALATALHGVRGKGLDLRQGGLAYERGYEHVKARAPVFGAMAAAVVLSFLFSVWAESRALAAENEALLESLGEITKSTFGDETTDPDEAENELEKARKKRPEDPMPYIDGFGLAVVLAEILPEDITHDVEEFDFAKQKLKIRGQVDSADDAQKVAKLLGEHRCISEPKITKITQVVNSSRERYVLESPISCPEDSSSGKKSKKKKKSGGGK